jgi:hypothetical protein
MAMDKELRPKRTSSQDVQNPAGSKAKADSGQARKGSEGDLFYINDQGEYCFGTECFSMRVKPGAGEVRVIVDRNECGTDAQAVIDTLFSEVVKGAPTVYETKTQVKK